MIYLLKPSSHYGIPRFVRGLAKHRGLDQSAYHAFSPIQDRFPQTFGHVADPRNLNQLIPDLKHACHLDCVRLHRLPSLELHIIYIARPELHPCMRTRMVYRRQ